MFKKYIFLVSVLFISLILITAITNDMKPEGKKVSESTGSYDAPPNIEGDPMIFDKTPLCDFDKDGDCDNDDMLYFQSIIGQCKNEDRYDFQADIDGSGCIDSTDEYLLFHKDLDNDGINDAIDNAPGIANPDQKDSDGDGIGDVSDDTFDVHDDS